jgi:hypothetical protein
MQSDVGAFLRKGADFLSNLNLTQAIWVQFMDEGRIFG